MGDYASGTNHVLPTYGYARMYSGVSLDSFQKKMTVQARLPDQMHAYRFLYICRIVHHERWFGTMKVPSRSTSTRQHHPFQRVCNVLLAN